MQPEPAVREINWYSDITGCMYSQSGAIFPTLTILKLSLYSEFLSDIISTFNLWSVLSHQLTSTQSLYQRKYIKHMEKWADPQIYCQNVCVISIQCFLIKQESESVFTVTSPFYQLLVFQKDRK